MSGALTRRQINQDAALSELRAYIDEHGFLPASNLPSRMNQMIRGARGGHLTDPSYAERILELIDGVPRYQPKKPQPHRATVANSKRLRSLVLFLDREHRAPIEGERDFDLYRLALSGDESPLATAAREHIEPRRRAWEDMAELIALQDFVAENGFVPGDGEHTEFAQKHMHRRSHIGYEVRDILRSHFVIVGDQKIILRRIRIDPLETP